MTPEDAKTISGRLIAEMHILLDTLSSRAMEDAASISTGNGIENDFRQIVLALHRHRDLIGPTFEFLDKMISAQKVEVANGTSGESEPESESAAP